MAEGVTQEPELAAMMAAAGQCQLPAVLRTPWLFTQARAIQASSGDVAAADPGASADRDESTAAVYVAPTMCRCGCQRPVPRARTGRPGLYASHACRQRAYRRRQRLGRAVSPGH